MSELSLPLTSIKKETLATRGIASDAKAFYVRATLKTKENGE